MIAISAALSQDIYYRSINPQATERKRLLVGRWSIIIATVAAGIVALDPPGAITQIVAWAFALASGTFFPALILGVWWKRANGPGVIAGMLVGLSVTLIYIFSAQYGGFTLFGIIDTGAGVFGAAAAIITIIVVSLATKAPSKETQEEVMDLRYPEEMVYRDGEVWLKESPEDTEVKK